MINALTSLRFIFALMVFGAHCYIIEDLFDTHFFKEGFVGVSFFFVLSGFIISYNYQNRLAEHITTKRSFWVARIARIYPLHWFTLFLSIVLGGYVIYDGGWDWCKHFLASLTLTQAYIPHADYFFSFNNSFTLLTGNLSSISTTSNRFNGNSFSPIRKRYSLTALRSIIIFPYPAQ